jgi:hypothetical protein
MIENHDGIFFFLYIGTWVHLCVIGKAFAANKNDICTNRKRTFLIFY